MEIRSYRAVFDLERRIYRIDRLRLNPGGMPVRGIVYFAAIALCGACLASLPGVGTLADAVPWYLREIALPGVLSALLAVLRIDGRPFHIFAVAALGRALAPRLTLGCGRPLRCGCWQPDELLLIADGSEARMRKLRYSGPGAVLVANAHERRELSVGALGWIARRPDLVLTELPERTLTRPQLIELGPGMRLQVR